RVDPGVRTVGHAVELEHRDLAPLGLLDCGDETGEGPVRACVARRWDQERVDQTGLIGEAAPLLVRVLRRPAATREANPVGLEDWKRCWLEGVARPGEGDRHGYPVLGATRRNGLNLLGKLFDITPLDAEMITGVIADLEPIGVKLGDLFPRHVVGLVGAEVETL